jgi:hypothetical protein
MPRPQIEITNIAGTLGGTLPTEDGVCLLVHNAPAAYSYTESVFTALSQVEAAGISEANDASNAFLLYEHIKDFFTMQPFGELHLLRIANTATATDLFTIGNAANTLLQNYLASKAGRIKIVGVSVVPAVESYTTSISPDVQAAIPLANLFSLAEYTRLRPIEIVFEGRKFSGTASAAVDLRMLASGNVSVVVARAQNRATEIGSLAANYAQIGLILGSIASVHVGRNIGRVLNGALPGVTVASFSGGQIPYQNFSDEDLNIISNKGYIFMDTYPGVPGWYWVDDHTCSLPNRTDAYIYLNRTAHKAARIALQTYVLRLKDEFRVDKTTGRLPAITVQTLQNELQKAIEREMLTNPDPSRPAEISGVTVRIDPNQNVLASGKIVARLRIVPLGIARIIETQVELINPAN